ncbi:MULTISPECIES: aminotransferase class V-fold PLP-dependent enzyme [unclassified Streptomyces]|uniref:aminotransferase class V-fold PLP-dependent enzyme n=1 Tax=unclassified Streptomyces TaxID=2593676 RepID=UPI00381B556E
MQRREPLGGAEFAPETTYLNSASGGLLPRRTAEALRAALDEAASHGTMGRDYFGPADASRAAFARLLGIPADRVAVGSSVAVQSAFVAGTLPPGSEVLVPEGDFSSLVNPLAAHPGIKLRTAPLDDLAAAVRPGTALVAFSAVQSLDGRVADLAAVRAAARAHGARTYLDVTQAAGWLPLCADDYDFVAAGAFKWLLCPRGTTFMAFGDPEGRGTAGWPEPRHAGWVAGADFDESCYGPIRQPAPTARRFDEPHALYSYIGARHSLALIEEIGVAAIHAHNTALADHYRAGLVERGHAPLPAPGSAIVSAPGLADAEARLAAEGIKVSVRGGLLRAAFHLYNSTDDADRLLDLLG